MTARDSIPGTAKHSTAQAHRGHSQTSCTRASGPAPTGKKQLHARHIPITLQQKPTPSPSPTLRPRRAMLGAPPPQQPALQLTAAS
ncbi:hypothetical protein PMIN05_007283 [Paraphaeosphaeria minitans]